jgi:hypothetical protein
MPPVVAPSPTTEPDLGGKRSVAEVNRLADQHWCAAVTTPIRMMQSVKLLV